MRRISGFVCMVLLVGVCGTGLAEPQSSTDSKLPPFGQRGPRDRQLERMQRDQARAQNKERQQNLKKDADKLLALASELKEYVDESNENLLSTNVVKKAEEIEKLAKSVKDKMAMK